MFYHNKQKPENANKKRSSGFQQETGLDGAGGTARVVHGMIFQPRSAHLKRARACQNPSF